MTSQSHFMLMFVLRKATLPNRINSVPWMNAVTPTPYHECTQLVWIKVALRSRQTACIHGTELVWPRSFMVRSYCDRVHSWYGVDVTAVIHGTELMWPRAFMVRSWCDSAKSFHVVPVYTVQWKFVWRIFSFLSFINDECGINLLCVSVTIRINRVVHSQHNFSATWIIKLQWTIIFNK